ncbi:MAG TPA: hypothetical protein GX530_07025 [Corynebacteriales bacterium]|nr:hypothetical protein [Mycobacteriales bacterium]
MYEPDICEQSQCTIITLKLSGSVLLDEYSLQVKESDLLDYLKATKNFWDEMPERAFSDADTIIEAFKKK